MAYGSYGNRSYSNNNYQSRGNYQPQATQTKPPFNLDQYVEELIDVYIAFATKLAEKGLTLPEDTIARWATSAKISMDK